MAARRIVEHLDVLEDIRTRHIARFVDTLLDPLLFQATEERLGDRVIPAISPSTHARLEIVGFAESQPIVAAVL